MTGNKFNCPYCRKELDLMELHLESDLNAIMRTMSTFGAHGHLVMAYCYLFGVSPLKLKAKKYRLLLEEMKRLFDAEAFSFEKRKYNISRQGIAEALDLVVKREFATVLHNHNYLKQVMIGIAERERTAKSKQDERDLRIKEQRILSGADRGQNERGHTERGDMDRKPRSGAVRVPGSAEATKEEEDYLPTGELSEDVKTVIADLKEKLGIGGGK